MRGLEKKTTVVCGNAAVCDVESTHGDTSATSLGHSWPRAGIPRVQSCPSPATLLHLPPAKTQKRNPSAPSSNMKAPRAGCCGCSRIFPALCLVHSSACIPNPCSSIAPEDGFGAVVPHCEQNTRVQRRHLAKINTETELEMFIFQLQAIHPVTLLCSSESPSVYIR